MKNLQTCLFLITITLLSLSLTNTKADYSDWININLYHTLDGDNFNFRGNITIRDLSTGSAVINQEPLNDADEIKLKNLAEQNKFYRLKAMVSGQDGQQQTFLSSSRACSLFKSQLMDTIFIYTDHVGAVMGVHQSVSSSHSDCSVLSQLEIDAIEDFNTEVIVKPIENAPVPDTATFLNRMEQERLARERGDTKDNRGFFAKYWMYIVPAVVIMLISGVANPEAQNGGGGGGGSQR